MTRKRTPKLEPIHSFLLCVAIALGSMAVGAEAAQAQTFTTLLSFSNSDGGSPQASLIMDAQGNLYGTTSRGSTYDCGTVFKLDPSGKETVLHIFAGNLDDGDTPVASLIMDASRNLYGTTYQGATPSGGGTVFKLDPAGNETILHRFSMGSDGGNPESGLIMDAQGNLYGTTFSGGAYGNGTVFKLDPSSNETVLHSFTGGSDGWMPFAGLIMDAQGNLYGTTLSSDSPAQGNGVIYRMDPAGSETVLYRFTGGRDGEWPYAALIMDAARNLYGTTLYGGNLNCNSGFGCGTVFKVDPSGNETVLYSFNGGSDGRFPEGSLIMDKQGNLYGTTVYGGAHDVGTVFRLDPSGHETVLHSFTGGNDGMQPIAGLLMDAANNLYGTTLYGGASNNCLGGCGTVFKLAIGQIKSVTTTTLASSLNPSTYGQRVTFTSTVATTGPLPPTGTVAFTWSDGSRTFTIGSATLSGGVATLVKSNLYAVSYPLTAVYRGDSKNMSSTSPILNQTVSQTTSAATISSSLNPSSAGEAVTFTAKITSPTVMPTGPVTFTAGTVQLGTAQLSGGIAKFTTSSLPAGSTAVRVVYEGDSNIKGSSANVTEMVQP